MAKFSHRARSGFILTCGFAAFIAGCALILFALFSESWRVGDEGGHECVPATNNGINTCQKVVTLVTEFMDGLIWSTRRNPSTGVVRNTIDAMYQYTTFPQYSRWVLITGILGLLFAVISILLLSMMVWRKKQLRLYFVLSSYVAIIFFTAGIVIYSKPLTASYSFQVYAYAPLLFQMGITLILSTNLGTGYHGTVAESASFRDHVETHDPNDPNDIDLNAIDGGIVLGEVDAIRRVTSRQQRQKDETKNMAKANKNKKKGKKRNQQSAMSGDDMESMDDEDEFKRVAEELGDELQ